MSNHSRNKMAICSAVSAALGAWAFYKTQQVTGPMFEPILAACMNNKISVADFADQTGYHAYEPKLGFGVLGPFICIITQFVHQLVENYPAGFLMWSATMLTLAPVTVLINVEAGRHGAFGILRYPLVMGVLYQMLGVSVVFPLLWVPAYCYGRSTGGAVSVTRAVLSLPLSMFCLALTILVFYLDPRSYLWTVCAGAMGGPLMAILAPMGLWLADQNAKQPTTKEVARYSHSVMAFVYGTVGGVALVGWIFLLSIAFNNYQTNILAFCADVWGPKANPSVVFMTIDAVILWLSLVVLIGFRDRKSALEALLLTPVFGPGGACALALAGIESNAGDETPMENKKDD